MLDIPDSSGWLKGEYVKDKSIKELTLVGEPPKGVTGDYGYKVECQIKYDGQGPNDPNKISWNLTSARILEKVFGKDENNWLNKSIPIEPSRTEKGYAIYVDEKVLTERHGGKPQIQKEID